MKRYGLYSIHSNRHYKNILPEGLIIPYQGGTSAPSGWDLYTAANDKWIVGAGSTYAVDENSATNSDIVWTTSDGGLHTGSTFYGFADGGFADVGAVSSAAKYGGTHTVTVSGYDPGYEQLVFIKSQSDNVRFPQDGIVLGAQDFSGLSVVKDNARLLKAGATITSGAAQVADSVTSSTSGNHDHRSTSVAQKAGNGNTCYDYIAAGGHAHTIGITLTQQTKRFYLSAWTDAAASFKGTSKMIAMYESVSPPAGWMLCDGTGGTPDLRDHFIQLDSAANDNQSAGDNTVNGTESSVSSSGGHAHQGGSNSGFLNRQAVHHSNSDGAHSDHVFDDDEAWLPPYYALAFIMRS